MLNQVILESTIVRNDGIRFSPQKKAYLPLILLFKTAQKQKNGWGEKKHFIKATLWGKSAQSLSEKIKPGTPMIIRGKLHQNTWIDKDGKKESSYSLTIEDFHFTNYKKRKISND